jgi:hypothetical protein
MAGVSMAVDGMNDVLWFCQMIGCEIHRLAGVRRLSQLIAPNTPA